LSPQTGAPARHGPVAGIDLGGTKVRVGIVDRNGRLLRAESHPTQAEQGPEEIIRRIAAFVQEMAQDAGLEGGLGAAGVGAPGPINVRTGVVSTMPNLPGWEEFPIRDRLQGALGFPVAVGNDASVAALAEHRYGAARGSQDMVYLSLGTGIGGGIIIGGRLYHGATGAAAEPGHMIIDPHGPPCLCGRQGCLEAFASGGGIERLAAARVGAGAASSLQTLAQGGKGVAMPDICEAARAGDALARELMEDASSYLGWGIVNLAHLLNPELIVFGGGLLGVRDLLIDPAIAVARERMFRQHQQDLRFATAALEEDAGALGAAALASDLLTDRLSQAL